METKAALDSSLRLKINHRKEESELNRHRIRELMKRLPKNNQNGFTLIELLVVISILGILAAVVTMSMVGITAVANDRASKTEKGVLQVAYDTMLEEQGVDIANACATAFNSSTSATADMTKFPSTTAYNQGNVTHAVVSLYPHYLRQATTHGTYYCAGTGEMVQVTYNP